MRYGLIVPLFVLIVACSGPDPATVGHAPATEAPSVEVPATVEIPGKVNFNIPSQLRSDKTYQTKAGATRRKVVYELLEAGPNQAEAAVTGVLVAAGYAAEEPKEGKNGRFSIRYKKPKAPNITATFYPQLAKKPASPDAKSMVALSWQTKRAPKAKAKVGSDQ